MTAVHRVAFLGLRDSERQGIVACLRLASARGPRYELTALFDEASLLIADAEHPPSVQLVVASEMLGRTLFIGPSAPAGAAACVPRPIDPQQLLRELDILVSDPEPETPPAQSRPEASPPPPRLAEDSAVDLLLDLLPDPLPAAAPPPARTAAAPPADADRRRPVSQSPEAPAPAPTPTPTALLVDDSEIALRFLESRLQRWGLDMDRALASGRAIELMSKQRYDFVFIDVELGSRSSLDGLALCQHIRRQQNQVLTPSVLVMVSAHATQMDRVRGGLAGCDAYLGKPLDEVELQRLLLRQGLKPRAGDLRTAAPPVHPGAINQAPGA